MGGDIKTDIEEFNDIFLTIGKIILNTVGYILFIIGLYFLRKTARLAILKDFFNTNITKSLMKSGKAILLSGIAMLISFIFYWVNELIEGTISLTINIETVTTFFLLIVGLFFMLMAKALNKAISWKKENELTI